jgi:hypothetical protein
MSSAKFKNTQKEIQKNCFDDSRAFLLTSFKNIELWIQPVQSDKEFYSFVKSINYSYVIPLYWNIEESISLFSFNKKRDLYDHIPEDFLSWEELYWLENIRHSHLYALEDFSFSRIDFDELKNRIQLIQKIPNGKTIPLSESDWKYIENLNDRLSKAQLFACENISNEVDCFELICWMREDDPDWFEDRENWIYYNPYISTMENYLNEDWNTFRNLNHDPLGGRKCGYFMHDLIDHGDLSNKDLLRIGKITVNIKYDPHEEVF